MPSTDFRNFGLSLRNIGNLLPSLAVGSGAPAAPIGGRRTRTGEEIVSSRGANRSQGAGNTLASSVYDRMRVDILTGALRPGDKLRADFLRTRYQVGTSPMREALNRLASDGLVVHEDQRGFRVATVSKEELVDLIKARCWLEEVALRQSIGHGDAEWEEHVVLAFHRLSRVPRSASETAYAINPEWERLHREFHRSLLSGCGSRWVLGFCDQLNDQTHRYRQIAAQAEDDPQRYEVGEHRAIMEATVARDASRAIELLMQHFGRTSEIILNNVPGLQADGSADAPG